MEPQMQTDSFFSSGNIPPTKEEFIYTLQNISQEGLYTKEIQFLMQLYAPFSNLEPTDITLVAELYTRMIESGLLVYVIDMDDVNHFYLMARNFLVGIYSRVILGELTLPNWEEEMSNNLHICPLCSPIYLVSVIVGRDRPMVDILYDNDYALSIIIKTRNQILSRLHIFHNASVRSINPCKNAEYFARRRGRRREVKEEPQQHGNPTTSCRIAIMREMSIPSLNKAAISSCDDTNGEFASLQRFANLMIPPTETSASPQTRNDSDEENPEANAKFMSLFNFYENIPDRQNLLVQEATRKICHIYKLYQCGNQTPNHFDKFRMPCYCFENIINSFAATHGELFDNFTNLLNSLS